MEADRVKTQEEIQKILLQVSKDLLEDKITIQKAKAIAAIATAMNRSIKLEEIETVNINKSFFKKNEEEDILKTLENLMLFIKTKSDLYIHNTDIEFHNKAEKIASFEDGFYFVSNKQIQPLANKLKTTKETLRKVLQQLSGKDTSQQYKLRNPKTGLKEKNNRYWIFSVNDLEYLINKYKNVRGVENE
jgi:Fe-S cluster assembly iron-binding protein IscA